MPAKSQWTKQAAANALAAKAEELGRAPRVADCVASTSTCPSPTIVRRLFGSWNDGLSAAGLENGIARHVDPFRNRWTGDEILDAIRDWAAEHGEPPTSRDWSRQGAIRRVGVSHGREVELEVSRWPLASLVIRRFGTWTNAIGAAGFEGLEQRPRRRRERWSKPAILASMATWVSENGRRPTVEEWGRLPRSEYPSVTTIQRKVGWSAALQAVGAPRQTETQRLLERVRENPGVPLRELVEGASVPENSVRSLVSKLVKTGEIRRDRESGNVRFWPT